MSSSDGDSQQEKRAVEQEILKCKEKQGSLDDGTVRIHVWASPRSLSTALMYSFAQRPDTVVHDEPLYAHFLRTHEEKETPRPYREQVFKEQDSDGDRWLREIGHGPTPKPVVYMKHIAKQSRNLDLSFMAMTKCRNVIQIRNPVAMLPSWDKNMTPTLKETGILDTMSIFSRVRSLGQRPIVVDADLLRANPEGVLREMSEMLGIPYCAAQLSWPKGTKPYDGCWGYLWYKGCQNSTCFENSPRYVTFNQRLAPLLEECMPIYQLLRPYAITGYGRLGKVPRPVPPSPSLSSSINTAIVDTKSTKSSISEREEMAVQAAAPNEDLLVWIDGSLVPRSLAQVSVFDSSVQGGDAVWEGVRVYDGKIFLLDRHLRRLQASAKALSFEAVPSSEDVTTAIMTTLAANGIRDAAHARVTLTRGKKTTSSMNPEFNVFGCTLIVLAERKEANGVATYNNELGVKLVTASNRRNSPQCLDSVIHHNNLLINILAKIEANVCGAADAIMLDVDGFVSETNATNLFMVKNGVLLTPAKSSCLPDIMRGAILDLAAELGLPTEVQRLPLTQFHSADEVFTTGTMGELTPVVEIDGRGIGEGRPGPLTVRLKEAFKDMTRRETLSTCLPDFRK